MSQLFYHTPANGDWNKALPIGNGKLGAMIFGEEHEEHFQLNEDSVWFGAKRNRNNADARKHLDRIRELILNGKISEAENLCKYALSGTPQSQHSYQTLGDVYFDFCGVRKKTKDFKRTLDLLTAVHTSKVTDADTGFLYKIETFADFDTNCIAAHFTSTNPDGLSLAASLQRGSFYETTTHTDDTLLISGRLGGGDETFCAGMCFVISDGTQTGMGEHLLAEHSSSITVLLTAATTFRHKNPEETVKETLKKAAFIPYEKLKEKHIKEYRSYFDRMHLSLPYDSSLDALPTDERLARIDKEHPDNGLINTYFDFGRYLLISSSRGDCLPANLQGIWNDSLSAPWGSKFTININTEMNYWPALSCRLADCEKPLFTHMLRMLENGKQTANKMYDCRGFVAHHNTDLWGDTAPQDIYIPATYWVMGGAWLATHIWNYYSYTKDLDFLKEMYPFLRECVAFFMDFLIEVNGELVTCPSVSPENTYIMEDGTQGRLSYGVTMDNEILHELFDHFEKAKETAERIPKIKIGKHGQIMEWMKDYDEAEPGHRHISHLWALHPAFQITPDGTSDLCDAAKITLQRRLSKGGGHTGWSRAWIMNMYARLWDGENAYKQLLLLFSNSTLPNLFDTHPPFQIDGNFGSIAAITEMLLQSREDKTILLPALPNAWQDGFVRGICGRENIRYDIRWSKGVLSDVTLHAGSDTSIILCYGKKEKRLTLREGETLSVSF